MVLILFELKTDNTLGKIKNQEELHNIAQLT